jgi:hypothetical protein
MEGTCAFEARKQIGLIAGTAGQIRVCRRIGQAQVLPLLSPVNSPGQNSTGNFRNILLTSFESNEANSVNSLNPDNFETVPDSAFDSTLLKR